MEILLNETLRKIGYVIYMILYIFCVVLEYSVMGVVFIIALASGPVGWAFIFLYNMSSNSNQLRKNDDIRLRLELELEEIRKKTRQ